MRSYKNLTVNGILMALRKSAIMRTIAFAAGVIIAILSLLAYRYGMLSIISMGSFVLASLLFCRMVLRMRRLRYGKLELVLMDDCDCRKYVEAYEAIRNKKPEASQLDTISIAKGYFFMGDFIRARKELESILPGALKGSVWIPYYNVAFQNYLELGELQHAKEIRQEIKKFGARQKPGSATAKVVVQLEKFADFADAFRRKDYETARKLQEDVLHLSGHAAQISLTYYRVAVMELDAGLWEDAKDHLDYVMQYGGQVFVKELAREQLEKWASYSGMEPSADAMGLMEGNDA